MTAALPVGIGILSYKMPHETLRLVESLQQCNDPRFRVCIYDNTDQGTGVFSWWADHIARGFTSVSLLSSGKNVGCAAARNMLWQYFSKGYPAMRYMVVLDQDIVVRPGWLDDMLEVAEQHEDTGQVIWPVFNMARDCPDSKGRIHDCAGGASLYSMAALQATQGWDSRFFFFRFDSWFTLLSYSLGWPTYMVTKYGKPNEDWAHWLDNYGGKSEVTCGPISHVNPSQGTKRHPDYHRIRAESQKLFDKLIVEYGFTDFYKNWPDHKRLPCES